ncbi:MAG: hypothetical protein SFY32_05165 [Bacteroidota bacterium]|nr:hypothetical protein [Bacteroidota bacterium]
MQILSNNKKEAVVKFNKEGLNKDFLISLFDRIQIESTLTEADFSPKVVEMGAEIKQSWWKKNSKEFLKNEKINK